MSQREARLSGKIRKHLELTFGADLFIFKVWGSEHQMAGLPDLIGCYRGRFFGIEVKNPETRMNVSPRQKLVGRMILKAGGLWAVCCTPAEAEKLIRAAG